MIECQTEPSNELVAAAVRDLEALEASDPTGFSEALADNIMEPDPVETEAFRSDQLVFKSLAAVRYLQENAQSVLKRRRRGSQQKRRTEGFIQKVGYERRILENVRNGVRARKGLLPNAPNPRQRALRRLASENLAGATPQGRFRVLVIEEQDKDKERKRQAKKQRQAARRADRGR
ncbi:MAG TPA: hypothetical protein VFJ19_05930 [Nocardioidaceae bacterium]|nr:hypothetical protein [Nocardioidaceae bacterium]